MSSPVPLWEALLPVVLPVLLISGDTLVDTFKAKDVAAVVTQIDGDAVLSTQASFPSIATPLSEFAVAPSVGDTIHVTPNGRAVEGVKPSVPFKPNSWNELKPYSAVFGNPALVLLLSMTIALITWVRWKKPGGDNFSKACLLYTSPSPRDLSTSRMPSSA